MSAVKNITFDGFPKQGGHLGLKVKVCFHFDPSRVIMGIVVRDDIEEPFVTIVELEDGRCVLSTECHYFLQ